MTQATNQDTTTRLSVTSAVSALLAATAAYNAAPEGTQDPLETPTFAAYRAVDATPARTPAEAFIRFKTWRWWSDDDERDTLLDSIEADLERQAGTLSKKEAAVLKRLTAPRQGSLDPAEAEAFLSSVDGRLGR